MHILPSFLSLLCFTLFPVSDTDSLSSVDDSQFKGSLKSKHRLSALMPSGSSDAMTLNNSNSMNASASMATGNETSSSRAHQPRRDKLESSEVKDLLISLVFVLKNLGTFIAFLLSITRHMDPKKSKGSSLGLGFQFFEYLDFGFDYFAEDPLALKLKKIYYPNRTKT